MGDHLSPSRLSDQTQAKMAPADMCLAVPCLATSHWKVPLVCTAALGLLNTTRLQAKKQTQERQGAEADMVGVGGGGGGETLGTTPLLFVSQFWSAKGLMGKVGFELVEKEVLWRLGTFEVVTPGIELGIFCLPHTCSTAELTVPP